MPTRTRLSLSKLRNRSSSDNSGRSKTRCPLGTISVNIVTGVLSELMAQEGVAEFKPGAEELDNAPVEVLEVNDEEDRHEDELMEQPAIHVKEERFR